MLDPKAIRILYMGTPEYAIAPLKALCDGGYTVVGVVTQPDKPQGRGYTLQATPVKRYALERGLAVYQPLSLKKKKFAALLETLQPELIVVTAYGKILPPSVLQFPKYGCMNLHGSLLPKYRGAAPMQRVLIDGEAETGVTVMAMDEGLDTGDMLYRIATPIADSDNFETIHDRLTALSAEALLHALGLLGQDALIPEKQDDRESCYAAKITREDCVLHFDESARALHNRIRGLSPVPLSFARLNGRLLKIVEAHVIEEDGVHDCPGEVISVTGGEIAVLCGTGVLGITGVLPEGKKRMPAGAFINGRGVKPGDRFETI